MPGWIGALGALLFVLVFLLDGWTRPGYSPVRHPVSALALGRRGWIQTTNFVVCGTTITIGGWGLIVPGREPMLGSAVILFGLGLVVSGIFPMDPMRGFPPGTPDRDPSRHTLRHTLHDYAGLLVFLALPVSAVVAAFVVPGVLERIVSAVAAVGLLVGFGRFSGAWEKDSSRAGLIQRAVIIPGWLWIAALFVSHPYQ